MPLSPGAWGAIGSIGSSLIGGGLGFLGAQDQNKAMRKAVQQQIDADRYNYVHRYQWTMDDMAKAGLNPILAYQQGTGGGVPGASTYSAVNEMGAIGAEVGRGVNSAMAAQRMEADVKLTEEQAKAAAEQVKNIAADTKLKIEQRNVASSEWMLKSVQQHLARNQASLTSAQTLKMNEDIIMRQLEVRIAREMEKIRKGEGARGQTREQIYSSLPGKILTWIDEIGQSINPFVSAGEKIGRTGR